MQHRGVWLTDLEHWVGVSCRKSSPAELVPPGLKRQRSACRIGSALPNLAPHSFTPLKLAGTVEV